MGDGERKATRLPPSLALGPSSALRAPSPTCGGRRGNRTSSSRLQREKGKPDILLPLAVGEGQDNDPSPACGRRWRAAPDEGRGGRSDLQCEGRAFEGIGAAADLFDGALHAAVAAEALVGERHDQAVGRGRWRGLAQFPGKFFFIGGRTQHAQGGIGRGRRPADAGPAVNEQGLLARPVRNESRRGVRHP